MTYIGTNRHRVSFKPGGNLRPCVFLQYCKDHDSRMAMATWHTKNVKGGQSRQVDGLHRDK